MNQHAAALPGHIAERGRRSGYRLGGGSLALFAILALHIFSAGTAAQTTTSTLEGTVKDANGAVIAGAQVKASSSTLATERTATTDASGFYRIVSLPAGTYTLAVSQSGFSTHTAEIELTLNRIANIDVQLQVGAVGGNIVNVSSELPLLATESTATGTTVMPRQIQDLPVNGRDYLDLLQLVPGTAINRHADPNGDNANPVLGERSGNNNFFIDGQPNKDTVNGGPAAQFNQETIAEFQVLTTGFKAEFGQASGAIVNVITKSGGNDYHGTVSFFHRNEFLDASNSLDAAQTEPPHLRRFDYSIAGGGPIWKDKIFFFGSSERITEDRGIDFKYPELPPVLLQLIRDQEDPLSLPQKYREIRNFLKLNQNFGRHQLVQQVNYTNGYTRATGPGLPSTRRSISSRNLMLGFGDTMLLGDMGDPWIVTLRGTYRGEPSDDRPAYSAFTGSTLLNTFPELQICPPTCGFFSTLPQITFGSALTPSNLNQKYTSISANANKRYGDHDFKFGWQFLRTKVDGLDSQTLFNQLFATLDDYVAYGPVNSGIYLLAVVGPPTPEAAEIHLNNNYNGLYFQDDWKLRNNLTVNLGLRWDHDSEFEAQKNFSPRLGVAWAITPKTIIRSHFGVFYDQFRLGLARQVPAFGGSDRRLSQPLSFPRGFYGSPSLVEMLAFAVGLPGPCISNHLTDAEITATGATCPLGGGPMVGVDRLNNVVAPGHPPIPANAVINISNIQALSGLTPEQYLVQAAAAIGQPAGYFEWGTFGVLGNPLIPPQTQALAVNDTFRTPHTLGFSVGVQREITSDLAFEATYHHREMRNLLGVRESNLAFRSRVAGIGRTYEEPNPAGGILTYGPFYEGKYDGLVLSLNKRLSNRYQIGASYTYAKATDNSFGIFAGPDDSFIGIAPTVTEPCPASDPACTPQTNANGSFTSRNGNFVAAAGTFVNGPDLDKGPSDLALDHIFQVNGLIDLPWQFQIGGIFRTQSGFRFSREALAPEDPDGNGNFTGIDFKAGRNAFTAEPFSTLDMRFSKSFNIGERVRIQALLEFFNVFNNKNPRAVQTQQNVTGEPVGFTTQVLPGREGQVGVRISF
ncbi:MAG: TonB-dependent receptor [Pyrinomonadaceae bacterium]